MTDNALRTRQGVLFAIAAYTMWGIAPIYFKLLAAVPALEILSHRIIWSFILAYTFTPLIELISNIKLNT